MYLKKAIYNANTFKNVLLINTLAENKEEKSPLVKSSST